MDLVKSHIVRVLALLFVAVGSLWGQADLHDWNNVKNIARGSDVWIRGAHGRCSGAFVEADDAEVRLQEWKRAFFGGRYSHLCAVPKGDVREVRFARRAVSALAGAAIGVGAGVGIGMAVEAQYPNKTEDGHLLAAVLGFAGALAGEAIGEHTAFIHGAKIYVAK